MSFEIQLITRERHRQHLQQCVDYLEEFSRKEKEKDFDKAAEDLRLSNQASWNVGRESRCRGNTWEYF